MPVIPYPDGTAPPVPPVVDISAEVRAQRNLTHWFIIQDPTTIVLIPYLEIETPSGGTMRGVGVPRDPQVFKLIPMSHTERPFPSTSGEDEGTQSKHDFTLLGEWDAIVEPGDCWTDPNGQKWIVDIVNPYNEYEVKALVMSYGKRASYGG